MPPKKNLEGQKFGRLLVIREDGRRSGLVTWLCRCDCGSEKSVVGSKLIYGTSTSCGCRRRQTMARRWRTHGMNATRIYRIWCGIITRTNNPNYHSYALYGGRGIEVCERWRRFENFLADMGPTYQDHLSIERIDNNGNYEPSNCRWATNSEQSFNKRNTVRIAWSGHTLPIVEWARLLGIPGGTLRHRVKVGVAARACADRGRTAGARCPSAGTAGRGAWPCSRIALTSPPGPRAPQRGPSALLGPSTGRFPRTPSAAWPAPDHNPGTAAPARARTPRVSRAALSPQGPWGQCDYLARIEDPIAP